MAEPQEKNDPPWGNTYWLYGSPGIGKTSLAHSICASLHDREQLAGAFFCQRDNPNLSKPINILLTLINKLAGIFPPFRTLVANHLRNDPNLSPESVNGSLFLDFLRELPCQPKHALIFVIDALDECGDDQSRPVLLKVLIDATAHAPWLKIIITSRPEVDIHDFFQVLARSSFSSCDLATDQDANTDLRTFAHSQFDLVVKRWCLPTPWPENSLFEQVISQANSLFIFIKTVILALEHCKDPNKSLKATMQTSDGASLKSLYGLYSSILQAQMVDCDDNFQQMIGVLLTTAPYWPLCKETIAELAGVRPYLVKKWVNDLSSLLYQDEATNGGVRVCHLSISEFFLSERCDYQVVLQDTLTWCRMPIRLFSGEFRTSAVSSSPSIPPSLSALHTLTFQRDPSYPCSYPYQASLANGLLNPSSCIEGNCCHGQCHHCNGLGTLNVSIPSTVPLMDTTLSLDPLTR